MRSLQVAVIVTELQIHLTNLLILLSSRNLRIPSRDSVGTQINIEIWKQRSEEKAAKIKAFSDHLVKLEGEISSTN